MPDKTNNKTKMDGKPLDSLQYEGSVSKKYVPEGFDSVDDFLQDMREEYDLDLEHDQHNREEAADDKKFAAGEQWDPIVLEHRKGLPNLTINSIPQFTAQLTGDWREERPSIKVVPGEDGDKEVASIRGDLVRAIEMKSRASRVYDSGFESSVQCGDGAWRVCVEYARDDVFDQDIFIRPIDDALSVVWDRLSVDPTGRDARHVFVDDVLPVKEFDRKWPDNEPSTLSDRLVGQLRTTGWYDRDNGVRVTEFWRIITRDRVISLFEDGSVHVIDEDTDPEELVMARGAPVRTRIAPISYAQMHLVTGHAILQGPFEYRLNRVPVIRCSGRVVNVEGNRRRFGLVRFMKDPVRLKNFWRSTAAEQLGYAPKAKWLAYESAVEGREDEFRKAHLSRDPLLVVNDGAEYPQQIRPAPIEQGLLNEASMNAQDMKDVTGIHDASLGIRSNETSGKAINARKREGDVASLTYYDNGNEAILETGDVINQLIGQIYDGTRIIRCIGEDQAVKFQKVNDPNDPASPDLSIGNYDVALQTGPSYTTRRVEAAEAMIQAVQVWPQIMEVAGDLVVKAQDWPGAEQLSERLKKVIPSQYLDKEDQEEMGQSGPSPQEIQQVMQQMQQLSEELQKLQKENEELKGDKTIDFLKIKIDEYNGVTQRIRALSDNEADNNQQALTAIKTLLDANPVVPDTQNSSRPGSSASSTGNNSPI